MRVHDECDRGNRTAFTVMIRKAREEAGWSLKQAAAELGIARSSLNQLELGRFEPTLRVAVRLADVYGISLEEMATALVAALPTEESTQSIA